MKKEYIRYSQCWEDAEILIQALRPSSTDIIVSITSGGCNTLALAACNPKKIYAIDSNVTQNYVLQLKLVAIKHLHYNELLGFLGYTNSNSRLEIFNTISHYLPEQAQSFFNENPQLIKQGIIHTGKFEKYLHLFRSKLLPLIHSKKTISALLQNDTQKKQTEFYNSYWDSFRWNFVFNIFFSAFIMKLFGRHKEMFRYNPYFNPAKLYLERTKKAFTEGPILTNYYLEYILTNHFSVLPLCIQERSCKAISQYSSLEIIDSHILEFLKTLPDNSIDKWNLSDIFEPMSEDESQHAFQEIYRVSKSGAIILFWNNLVVRKPLGNLAEKFTIETQQMQQLQKLNKIFFYETFYIMTICK